MKENEEVVETINEEVVEAVEKVPEESAVAVEDASEVLSEETAENIIVEDTLSDDEVQAQINNMKKSDAAEMLITKTKHIVNDAEKQMEACKLLLQEDLKSYEEAKEALKSGALDESEELLDVLGYVSEGEGEEEEIVVFESKEELPPFIVKDISSGKFTGFLMALIAGAATFAGLVYFATEKVGITLDVTKVPSVDTAKEVLGWYATLFGGKPDLFLGGGFVALVTLLIMAVVYAIRVSSRANSNLAFAKTQLSEAEEYVKYKGNCKEEMDKVDAHMQDAIETMKTYQVILHEQNAKLKRILHIEGQKEDSSHYHEKSRIEMKDTESLIEAIKNFMGTSMSEEGKLSGKSTLFLHSAKSKLQKVLDRHY